MEQYFKFDGSATRSEFWGVNILAGIAAFILILIGAGIAGTGSGFGVAFGVLLIIATFIAAIWITLATTVRRCKNSGLNPWWAAATLVPYLGTIVFIVLGCLKTEETRAVAVESDSKTVSLGE